MMEIYLNGFPMGKGLPWQQKAVGHRLRFVNLSRTGI